MRNDLEKITLSAGKCRTGGHYSRKTTIDLDGPTKISLKKDSINSSSYYTRYSDIYVNPLKRFLNSKVGKNWELVCSEIYSTIKSKNGFLIKDLLHRLVINDLNHPYYDSYLFHVDENGILKKTIENKRANKQTGSKIISLDGNDYFKYENIWYRVKVDRCIEGNQHGFFPDVFGQYIYFGGMITRRGSMIRKHELTKFYGEILTCTWKQQANSKECKKLNER